MVTDWQDRYRELAGQQGNHPLEDDLLYSEVDHWEPSITSSNRIEPVVLKSGTKATYKPWDGLSLNVAHMYGHSLNSTMMAECAAWRLASALGPPVEALVPVCVWRDLTPNTGSLAEWRPGRELLGGRVIQNAPDQAWAAAFFDALVGQQDRHESNLLWSPTLDGLGLHDNGYTFARPGDHRNSSFFVGARWAHGDQALAQEEEDALRKLLGSSDLHGLALCLEDDRAQALADRARRMLDSGTLLQPNEY